MKRTALHSNRRYKYTKVLDNRKHSIRGLWRRNNMFFGRITVEDDIGRKSLKWVPLEATTAAEAQDRFRTLLVERRENRLRHIGRCPTFSDYLEKTYLRSLDLSGKKPDTLVTEKGHLNRWRKAIGHLCLDKIRPHHINAHLQNVKAAGRANRTCNLALVCLRNLLHAAKVDGYIKTLPVDGIDWKPVEKKARRLYTREDINHLCDTAFKCRGADVGENALPGYPYENVIDWAARRNRVALIPSGLLSHRPADSAPK
jgi:hypothetical protein